MLQLQVQLFFELVVDEIGRFVENQQFRVGDQGAAQQRALYLSAGQSPDRFPGDLFDPAGVQQFVGLLPILGSVPAEQSLPGL